MLTAEEQMELGVLKKHGTSIRGVARSTGHSRNTVRRYVRGGEAASVRKPAPKRAEKLDPFKSYIVGRVAAAAPDRIPAAVLFREICDRGYAGGETRVKQFVRELVPAPAAEPVARFETDPGLQMQADWASVGRGGDKLKVFIATLGWSRAAYVELCDDEKVETLIACHENALRFFGGVPREVLYDNMRTVVLERNTYGRGVHRFHPGFLDYARHAGFLPRLCQPYRAQTKGKVERFIGYLKGSFWVPFVATMRQSGLAPDKHAANAAVSRWLREVANARVHATTGEVPAERLVIEMPTLQPLSAPYTSKSSRSIAAPPRRITSSNNPNDEPARQRPRSPPTDGKTSGKLTPDSKKAPRARGPSCCLKRGNITPAT
ncbi:MAG: IS21 family transposase [Hyphomicrobiaceae bacterium]